MSASAHLENIAKKTYLFLFIKKKTITSPLHRLVPQLGSSFDDRRVVAISAGANHVMALTASSGNQWATNFKGMLPLTPHEASSGNSSGTSSGTSSSRRTATDPGKDYTDTADVNLFIEGRSSVEGPLRAHSALLAARSAYLRSYSVLTQY